MAEDKANDKPDDKGETLATAAQIAEAVKAVIKTEAKPLIDEALKPYVEKGEHFKAYADSMIELERKKAELNVRPEDRGLKAARYCRLTALGKGDIERGIHEATKSWGADDPVVASAKKALTASSPSAAGGLIPQVWSSEFIDLLRSATVVRSFARIVPMPQGNLTLRRQTAAATAVYEGESVAVSASQQTIGTLNLSFKKLLAITGINNSLLRFAGPEADRLVRDDLIQVISLKQDLAFLVGDGTSNTPVGLLNLIDAANQFADAGTTFANQIADYTKAIKLVEEADVPLGEDGHWVMAPRVKWGIYKTAGATEDATLPFKEGLSMSPPRLLGYQVHTTTAAKKTLVGNTESTQAATADRIFFVHGASCLIGDSLNLQVEQFDGAAYVDSSGTLVSAVSRDEQVIRVVSEHDFNMRYTAAGAVITGVSVGN